MSDAAHPCFHREAHGTFGRIHLPVAPECNIHCGFCDRRYACANESRPGVTAALLTPEQARDTFMAALENHPRLRVAGIAGPGDPLANPRETLATLELVRRAAPHVLLCLSCNGLALPEYADALAELGVGHVTVTVNAATPEVGARIYQQVQTPMGWITGPRGATLLHARQEAGIRRLRALGVAVKVNTVVIPGVNDAEVPTIAREAASWGAELMNCIPLIAVAGTPLGNCPAPTPALMHRLRAAAEAHVPQMRHCARCRADALGLLGEGGIIPPHGGLGLAPYREGRHAPR